MLTSQEMEALRETCSFPLAKMRLVASDMQAQMRVGLAADGQMLKMLPTYVTRLPDGCERAWLMV